MHQMGCTRRRFAKSRLLSQRPASSPMTSSQMVTCLAAGTIVLAAGMTPANAADSSNLPEIRTTANNAVPACVTPERLMSFITKRTRNLDPKFRTIATHYKTLGEAWRIRWDYAFFQMVVETNFLSYRQPNGRMGDVDPGQNNFAGIGTTGGGVPGDRFPDVKSGVLGQMQHLVAYSGERVAAPVASRTELKQDHIIEASRALGRPVRFSDLSRRWAVDKNYGRSIEWAAQSYRSEYCAGKAGVVAATESAKEPDGEALPWLANGNADAKKDVKVGQMRLGTSDAPGPATGQKSLISAPAPKATKPALASAPKPATKPAIPPVEAQAASPVRTVWSNGATAGTAPAPTSARSEAIAIAALAPPPAATLPSSHSSSPKAGTSACKIQTASYGGTKTLLIRTNGDGETHYTALTVLDGFETSMSQTFIGHQPTGGEAIAEFPTKDAALAHARELCPAS